MTDAAGLELERERERSKRRRERVIMVSLVEILTILVFVALTFALVTQNEAELGIAYRQLYEAEREDRLKAEADLASMTRDRDRWERIARAAAALLNIPREATPEEMEAELGRRAGTARGVCRSPEGALLAVHLLADGNLRVAPGGAWTPEQAAESSAIPGFAPLTTEGVVSNARFRELARQIDASAGRRSPPCRYRADIISEHESRALFVTQVNAVREHFFVPVLR